MSINFIKVQDINGGLEKDPAGYISRCEDIYNRRLREAAERIYAHREESPLVLLSGPSGSGKTTSALRIGKRLREMGAPVHIISMDNYFLPDGEGEMPLDENGSPDLESPLRMDIPLFTGHLEKLLRCEEITLPRFSFRTQSRTEGQTLRRGEGEIVILEGIHALNPLVTGDSAGYTQCLYVSVRTRIVASDGSVLHPRTIRLMRRLCRDKLFRGRNADDVIAMLPGVTRGEELYIMPYKERADMDIDTFMAYEPSVYSGTLLRPLEGAGGEDCATLRKVLRELTAVPADDVPTDSLVREFIGGSSFRY